MSEALDILAAIGGGDKHVVGRGSYGPTAPAQSSAPVKGSPELQRIRTIPRRSAEENLAPLADARARMERLIYRPGGKMRLRYEQPQALTEAMLVRGLWAPIAVGRGKTLIAALMPTVLDIGPSVILTNAGLVAQARNLMREYAEHFFIRNDIHWMSYSVLSSPRSFDALTRLKPRLIIADECQALASADAARTKRFNRYMEEFPETLFGAMSGSVTRRSIKDYAHLMHLAMRESTPLPRDYVTLAEWAEALDVSDRPRPPGAIAELITAEQITDLIGVKDPEPVHKARIYINGLCMRSHNWESEESAQVVHLARDAVRRRVNDTIGVVASSENALDAQLCIEVEPSPECPVIAETLKKVLDMWERPDGELLTYGLEIARVTKHVRQGGFYRWVWPKSVDADAKRAWLETRREYRKELREFLKGKCEPGLDSPFLVEQAILRGELDFDCYAPWKTEREEMRALLDDNPTPPTEWVWVSKTVVQAVAALVRMSEVPVVVWTETSAVGQEIARELEMPWYGAGTEAATGILAENGRRSIGASVNAHGTGRNMQAFSEARVVGWPPSGARCEQLLGRHHRPGQEAESVTFRMFDSFKGELMQAIRDARYIAALTGNDQKLLTARMTGDLNREKT